MISQGLRVLAFDWTARSSCVLERLLPPAAASEIWGSVLDLPLVVVSLEVVLLSDHGMCPLIWL